MRRVDTLVIGAGVAGLSTAYFLSRKGQRSVLVLEQEKKLGGHASGRNAGMLRQALSDPVLAELAVRSRRFFAAAEKSGWPRLDLRPNGSLLLCMRQDLEELTKVEATVRAAGLKPRWLSNKKAVSKVPLLKDGRFEHALFCPSDAMVDIQALLEGFLNHLKEQGVGVLRGRRLESVRAVDGGFCVESGREKWFSKKIVNAAGAWAGWVAQRAGASSVPLVAYRRHLYFTGPSRTLREHWPFVWDVSHDFYFRPIGRKLMLSPCDKSPETRGDREEKVNPAMQKNLYEKLKGFSKRMSEIRVTQARSGLRTMTPDGRFLVGEDAVRKNFYWVAGLGGHGVTTCFSVGELCADIVLGNKANSRWARLLSPGRFTLKKDLVHAS